MSIHTQPPSYSVVIPFYNEADNAGELIAEIRQATAPLAGNWEYIFVDDGSRDATPAVLERAISGLPRATVLSLATNSGQAAALYTGLQAATGDILITMDGDGQNVPDDIPALLEQLTPAVDMVVGIRQGRQDSKLRLSMSRWANRVRGRVLRDGVCDSGCALKVFRRSVLASLIPIRTLYSFMPAMAAAGGFAVTQCPVRHRARTCGTSNYGLGVFLWRPLVDMLGMLWFTRRAVRMEHVNAVTSRVDTWEKARPLTEAPH